MAITRTPMVDDDGSGLTGTILNNAWKQELYGQIDAAIISPAYGSFTPTDLSGAGLGLGANGAKGTYAKIGRLVFVTIQIPFPATANSAQALIGGLPFPQVADFFGGLYEGSGALNLRSRIAQGTSQIDILNATTGAFMTNVQLSAVAFHFHGAYFTT